MAVDWNTVRPRTTTVSAPRKAKVLRPLPYPDLPDHDDDPGMYWAMAYRRLLAELREVEILIHTGSWSAKRDSLQMFLTGAQLRLQQDAPERLAWAHKHGGLLFAWVPDDAQQVAA